MFWLKTFKALYIFIVNVSSVLIGIEFTSVLTLAVDGWHGFYVKILMRRLGKNYNVRLLKIVSVLMIFCTLKTAKINSRNF